MNFQTHVKIFCSGKVSRKSGNFSHNIDLFFDEKNSFQTHINILDCLEKFPVLWKSFQKFWKTFRKFWKTFKTNFFFYYFMKNSFHTSINILYGLKNYISSEKFQKNLENFPDHMNLLFIKKKHSTHTLTF